MKRLLFALSLWLAMPLGALAASAGTSCTADMGMSTAPGVVCLYLCATIVTNNTFTCGPIKVPVANAKHVTVRVVSQTTGGAQFTDCTVDAGDVVGLMRSTDSVSSGYRPVYATLDDDTPAGGLFEVKVYGPVDPYIGINGLLTAGNCATANHGIDVIGLFYEDNPSN